MAKQTFSGSFDSTSLLMSQGAAQDDKSKRIGLTPDVWVKLAAEEGVMSKAYEH
jgi:hypothetical protein